MAPKVLPQFQSIDVGNITPEDWAIFMLQGQIEAIADRENLFQGPSGPVTVVLQDPGEGWKRWIQINL